jgi:hypothetical protein
MKPVVIPLLAALLASCQSAAYEGDENSPFYLIPAGSSVTLNRELTIPAEQVAVFLQGGEVASSGKINQYYPHCKFELRHRRDTARTVQPDRFEITKVTPEIGHSVALDGLQLAGVSVGIGINIGSRGDGDGASLQTWSTRMTLRSARQPEVFRLSCGQTALPHEGRHVSINEMRKALGAVITLQLPSSRSP